MDQVSVVNDGRPAQARAVQEHGPRTHRTRRTRTAPHPPRYRHRIDDLRKSLQTEMISPPLWPRLFWYLFLLSGSIHFRGIFVANMRLVRLFPDACNGDVTHYTRFRSGRGAYSARSSAETRFARLRSGHKIPITHWHYTTFQSGRGAYSARSSAETRFARLRSGYKNPITKHFGPDAERISRDLTLKRASRVSVPGIKFRSHIGITQHFGPDAERSSRDLTLKRASRVSVPDIKIAGQDISVRTRSVFRAIFR